MWWNCVWGESHRLILLEDRRLADMVSVRLDDGRMTPAVWPPTKTSSASTINILVVFKHVSEADEVWREEGTRLAQWMGGGQGSWLVPSLETDVCSFWLAERSLLQVGAILYQHPRVLPELCSITSLQLPFFVSDFVFQDRWTDSQAIKLARNTYFCMLSFSLGFQSVFWFLSLFLR